MKSIRQLIRTTRTAKSKKNKGVLAHTLVRRRRNRWMQIEPFEPRMVMASNFGDVLTTDGTWTGNECNNSAWYNELCQSHSPVAFTNGAYYPSDFVNGLTAPDGGKADSRGSSQLYNTFVPNNGLLTVDSGQTNRDFAVQQEIEVVPTNYFPSLNLVQNPSQRDITTYQTSIRVPTTGVYTFYFSAEVSGASGTSSLNIADKTIELGRSSVASEKLFQVERLLTTTLTAGTDYPINLRFDRANTGKTFGLDWSGPGVPRQRLTPTDDVVWKNEFPSTPNRKPESGFITVGTTIDARKRLVDDNYAIRYTTTFTVPAAGNYEFSVTTIAPINASLNSYNDAANIKIDSAVVVSKDKTVASASGRIQLREGTTYTLEVNYLHRQPFTVPISNLKVEWTRVGSDRREFKPTTTLKYEFFQGSFDQFSDFANRVPTKSILINDPNFFALSWKGQATPLLPVGASADDVKKALMALSNIGAVGGSVAVTKWKDGQKYSVTFGGSIAFHPPLIEDVGTGRVTANPLTKYSLTKRDAASDLKLERVYDNGISKTVANLSNGNTFPISNAPAIIPTRIDGKGMQANIEIPGIGGTFEPIANPGQTFVNNISSGSNGFEVVLGTEPNYYRLVPQKGANGIARPISLLKIGGLDFEASPGEIVQLVEEVPFSGNSKLKFIKNDGNAMLLSAAFEGGKLTVAINRTSNAPSFSASLSTGIVTGTSNIQFVSFEIGGMVIPASNAFKMNYDSVTDKFTFTINNLNVETKTPTGIVQLSDASFLGSSFAQSFEMPGITAAGSMYESAKFVPTGNQDSFRSIAEFEAAQNKVTGTLTPFNAFQFRPGLLDDNTSFGTRYKTSFTVPTSGRYTFQLSDGQLQQLKIDNTVLRRDTVYGGSNNSVSIDLTAGDVHSLEYTIVYGKWSLQYYTSNPIKVTGGNWSSFELGGNNLDVVVTTPKFGTYNFNQAFGTKSVIDNVLNAAFNVVDAPSTSLGARYGLNGSGLTEDQRKQIKSQISVSVQGSKLIVTGLPYVIKLGSAFGNDRLWEANYGTLLNPVKLTLKSGTISISNGVLSPLTDIPVDAFSIGRTTIDASGSYLTEYEPLKPSAGGFKLSYFSRNTYTKDNAVDVPGNSFGIYGSETQLPLDVAGVKLNGLANLGTATSPGLVVTNGQFNRLSYSVPDVTVDGLIFKAASVGSAKPLSVNYFPPQGFSPKSYVVLGGAVLKAGGTLKSDLKANLGGMGSDGLRIYPARGNIAASFTFGFGVADTFLAGTQAIQAAPGSNGLKLLYEPKTKIYNFFGNAYLDYNPTRPHTPTDLSFTGTKLSVSATVPSGVTNFPANRLDSNTLNFFLSENSSINGFKFSPLATSNPLRVTIINVNGVTTDTISGAFSMGLDGGNLYGVMDPTSFTNATYPTAGYVLDFSPRAGQASGIALVGVTLDGAKKANLTKTLSIKFPVASFDGNVIAQGTEGSEVAILEAQEGKLTKAQIVSPAARVIGDFQFQNYTATYSNTSAGKSWAFVGAATFFGKRVEVGKPAPGNPQLKIGGDPIFGVQLRTISTPFDPLEPQFQLPSSIEIAGLNFDTSLIPQDLPVSDQGAAGKVYSLKSQNYGVKLGNTTLSLSLGAKIRVSSSGVAVESFSATGVQNTSFTIGNASLQIKSLTVEYVLATKTLQISGNAKFTFKAKAVNVDMDVNLGTKQDPGLVIRSGAVESFKVAVTGTFELLKLSVAAEAMTVEFKKENQEYAIYGTLRISTAAQGGVQVIKDLAVTLGGKDNPGIKIVNGSLDSLDISVTGEINLFKITASPKDLRIRYTASKNLLQITGELSMTLAPKLTLTAALPGEGLLIDTTTGKVQIRGLSLAADGEIKFGAMTIKGLKVEYSEDDAGEVSIAAAAEIQLPSGLAVGGSFKIINGKLDSIGISFEKNPGILVANGLVNIYRIEASVEGLTNLDNFKISGTVKATVGPLVKFGGESYALADVTGTVNITPSYLELLGDVQLVGGKFGNGKFSGRLLWNPKADDQNPNPRVTFEAEVNLYPGDIVRGKINAYVDIKGNVDFKADMGVFIPQAVPLAGGVSLGQLQVELRVRPAEEPSASYAKFAFSDISVTAFRVPTFYGSVRIGFDKIADFNFGARFYIPLPWPLPDIDYSIDVSGKFELRDASNNPFVQILAASSISGTPNGEVLFSASSPLPDDTFIDIYADNDNLGNDGLLIASSIPYRTGTQTFTWNDMAAFAKPGEPVYVYAVINDGKHAVGYSDYSPRFNVAPGFIPSVVGPAVVSFVAGAIAEFRASLGNAIVIGDPRNAQNAASEVEVVLNVGGGTIDLSHAPDDVRYTGAGTGKMTLRGSAQAITSALDGMRYVQLVASSKSDQLDITVNNLPLENMNGGIKTSIVLKPNPLAISLMPTQDANPTTITMGNLHETPLENVDISSLQSSHMNGAVIAIAGYEKGKDFLSLPLSDETLTDVNGSFDFDTGTLTLSGFEWTEDYEDAFRKVVFETSSPTNGKSLVISLADDRGDTSLLTVPLSVIVGHNAPQLALNSTGVSYLLGFGQTNILPEGTVDVEDGSRITSVAIGFIEGSYIVGQDVLSYAGNNIQGVFDSVAGILTLTGNGTATQWSQAIQQVKYASVGSEFTEGNRYLGVTVTDNASDNNVANSVLVIDKSLSAESHVSPVLSLTSHNRTLPAHEDFAYLDNQLTLSADAPMLLWASVAISGNYIEGEDQLSFTTLWDGMTADFDPSSGILNIRGLATTFEYEDVLRSVIFVDSAAYRTPGPAEITFTVFDGLSSSEVELLNLDIEAAPFVESSYDQVLLYDGGQTADTVNSNLTVQHSGQISGASVSLTSGFMAGEDVLTFDATPSITGSFDGQTGVLTLRGNASTNEYEAALRTVKYKNLRFNPSAGDRIVEFQVHDLVSMSNVWQSLVVVEAKVVPPRVTLTASPSYTEDGSPVPIAPNFHLTTLDASTTFLSTQEVLYGADISIINYLPGEDILTSFGLPSDIQGSFDPVEGRIFLTGQATFDEYETAIRNIVYSNSSEVPTAQSRLISIRLLDSSANGMNNQTITTQVIVGLPDPVSLTSGSIEDLQVLQNASSTSLGLNDLTFLAANLAHGGSELVFVARVLPADSIGSIVLSDRAPLQLNQAYPLSQLQGLRFEPHIAGVGVTEFSFQVALSDTESGNIDSGAFADTIKITVNGIATSTSSQAFVAQMSRDLLGENPDQTTLSEYASKLDQTMKRIGRETDGFMNEEDVRLSMVADYMNGVTYRRNQLNAIYLSLLNRIATTGEMNAQLAALAANSTLEQIHFSLLASDEYFLLQGTAGFGGYIQSVYQDLLGRSPTASETSRWVKALTSGQSRISIVKEIGNWSNVDTAAREQMVSKLLHREFEFKDNATFDFTSHDALLRSVIASEEYYLRSSTPTNTTRILTHTTSDYPSVGTLGDIAGDKAGGTLIAPQYVLVAAHSVAGMPPGQITFTIGGQKYTISDIFIHPDFDSEATGSDFGNDIAIIRLNQPVIGITPSVLSGTSPRLGDVLSLVGFGQEGGAVFGTKRVGSTPQIDSVGQTTFRWTQTSLIQNDSDPGDSGSPLLATVNGIEQVVGIVSGGTTNFSGVGDTATNTRVDKYLAWIHSIVPTVQAVYAVEPPSIDLSEHYLYIDENAGLQRVPFQVASDTAVEMAVNSSTPDMFTELRVDFDQSGKGSVLFTTATNVRGTATIVLTAFAGTTQRTETMTVTVEERNDRPTVDPIPLQVADANTTPQSVLLTGLSAGVGEQGIVRLAIQSTSPTHFFSSSGINYAAGASSASLNYTLSPNASGRGSVVVEIRDAGVDGVFNTADDAIANQMVQIDLNNAPALDAINNIIVLRGTGLQTIPLTGINSGETPAQAIQILATSSDASVISDPTIIYDPGTTPSKGQLQFTPSQLGLSTITVTVRDLGNDGVLGSADDRSLTRSFTVNVVESLHAWQNPRNRFDVNDDNTVEAFDVLVLINAINRNEDGRLPIRSSSIPPFYDVNGNDELEPLDVLMVINEVNRSFVGGEGEIKAVSVVESVDQYYARLTTPLWSNLDWLEFEAPNTKKSKGQKG